MRTYEGRLFKDGAYGEHREYYAASDVESELTRLREENQRQAARIAELEKDVEHKERWGNQYFELWDEVSRKLADFESQLAEVRAERPEVEFYTVEKRGDKWYAIDSSGDVSDLASGDEYCSANALQIISDLQRAEAAWRSTRDCWQVETERLKQQHAMFAGRILEEGKRDMQYLQTRAEAAEARVRELESHVSQLRSFVEALAEGDDSVSKAARSRLRTLTPLALPQTEQPTGPNGECPICGGMPCKPDCEHPEGIP